VASAALSGAEGWQVAAETKSSLINKIYNKKIILFQSLIQFIIYNLSFIISTKFSSAQKQNNP